MKEAPSTESSPRLETLLTEHRDRLKRMIRCRMDRRMQGRVDASDVIQEAYLEASRRYADFKNQQKMPFYLWLRFLTMQQLLIVTRKHLGVKMRSVAMEGAQAGHETPAVQVEILADALSGHFTSPSSVVARQELQSRLSAALDALDPKDREVLTLRHFEQLNTVESAQVLGISEGLASTRYGRAVRKLLAVIKELFGSDSEFRT